MLLSHFDQLLRTPGDVEQLNRTILELAVRGQLDTHNPDDEPATALLARIRAEKQRLEEAGEIRRSKPLPQVKPGEMPFALPEGWVWVRFGDITFNRDGERIPLSKAVREGRVGPYDYYGASGVIDHIDDYLFDKPLLLIGEDGANLINRSTPIAFIAYGKYWVNNHAHVLDAISLDILKFLTVFVNAIDLKPYVTGTAQPKMNQAKMNSIVVALPPLAEQQRIVAAVEGLLAATAGLGESLAGAEAQRQALTAAALHRLESASDPSAAAAAWALIREHFAALIHTPESVAGLKQTILQLAVQGRLVPQQPGDEPASALLARIRAEKQRLEEAGEIRRSKPLPKVKPEEMPCALPGGWVWVRLGDAGITQTGTTPSTSRPEFYGTDFPFVKPADIRERGVNYDKDGLSNLGMQNGRLIPAGSVLMVCIGGSIGKVSWTDRECSCNQQINALTPYLDLPVVYLTFILGSPYFQAEVMGRAPKTTLPILSKGKWEQIPIPLPPLAEQKRIVERVEALFALCDGLAGELAQAEAVRGRWVAAVLAGAG